MNELDSVAERENGQFEKVVPISTGADASLDRHYRDVLAKAEGAIDYYRSVKKSKKRAAQLLRLLAVLLISAAGLIPILDAAGLLQTAPPIVPITETIAPDQFKAIVESQLDGDVQYGQLGYLFAAIAAALIGLDKFLGLSSSWTRYITAELNIQRCLDRFQIDWAIASANLQESGDQSTRPSDRLQLLKDFSMEVSQIIENETQVWVSEFQSALAALEKSARERQEAARPGSVQVTINKGEGIESLVKVHVDGRLHQTTSGRSVSVYGLRPGDHDIRLEGKNADGQDVMASQIVTVPSGGTSPVDLNLA